MSAILELSTAVRTRRADMGLTQTTLAKLSGLSRATVNQVENGTIHDLSLTRAAKLLGILGLSVNVTPPRQKNYPYQTAKSSALDLAARTASVSFRATINANQLRDIFTTEVVPSEFTPHLYILLEESSVSLLAAVVEELHQTLAIERTQAWKTMRNLGRKLKSNRDLWL